jgi:hypothetical protein
MTEKTIRLVTSTYNDEHKLQWLPDLITKNIPYIVYKKNPNLQIDKNSMHTFDPELKHQCLEIPNFGRCEYAFFYHIVANYDNLDDITIFTKCNWRDNDIPLWDLVNDSSQYDYMNVGTHAELLDFANEDIEQYRHIDKEYENNIMLLDKLFDYIFGDSSEKPTKVRVWGHGPCFSVSKKMIQRHPKSIYEYFVSLMEVISEKKDMINEIALINHDKIQRFYTVLFTHNIVETEYNIYPNENIPRPDTNN